MLNDHIDVESELLKYYSSRTLDDILTTCCYIDTRQIFIFSIGIFNRYFLLHSLHWNRYSKNNKYSDSVLQYRS